MSMLPALHELTPETLPGSYQTAFGIISVQKFAEPGMKVRGYNPFTRRSFMLWANDEGVHMRSTQADSNWWGEWESEEL